MTIKLLKLTKNHIFSLFLSFLSSIFAIVLQTVFIYIAFNILIEGNFQNIWILVVLGLTISILRFLEQYLGHLVAFKLLCDLRNRVYSKLRLLSPARIDKNSGELIKIISSDIEMIEVFYAHTIVPVMVAITYSIIQSILYYKILGTKGIIVIFLYIILSYFYPMFSISKINQNNDEITVNKKNIRNSMIEIVRGKFEINQFNFSESIISKITSLFNYEEKRTFQNNLIITNKNSIILLIIAVVTSILLLLEKSTNFWIIGLIFTFDPIIAISKLTLSLKKALKSSENLFNFLEEKEIVRDLGKNELNKVDNIEFVDANFEYPNSNSNIFSQLNLKFEKNKIYGIKGKSGIGKSSLVKLIMRWYDISSGQILINSLPISDYSLKSLRSNFNYLEQRPIIFSNTLRENLSLGLDISDESMISTLEKLNIGEKFGNFKQGLDTIISNSNPKFSSGELQRIELGRAFLHKCEVLILDEPISNLDINNQNIILDFIKNNYENIVIIISHNEQAFKICDEIINFEDYSHNI